MAFRHQIDRHSFIGRQQERLEFQELFKRRQASLVTCQGRRRIGKSRFISECALQADHFLTFSGLAPREGLTRAEQIANFAEQLALQTHLPRVQPDHWPAAFQLLASQLSPRESTVILLDEISWMGIGDPDFSGHLKNAWDLYFSGFPKLILVLCGSVSSWIQENILNNTGFVGRTTWQFHLKPLPLPECNAFWRGQVARISPAEKWQLLAVTGGVPGYLEQIQSRRSALDNIERLCFHPGGMLFHECDRIFHDIFTRRADTFKDICHTLLTGPKSVAEISAALKRERGGSLGAALQDLELAGFLRRDAIFDPATGKNRPREHQYRIADPYLRFYLKYVAPNAERIRKGLYQMTPLESMEAWDTMMGFQFETLMLDNLALILAALNLKQRGVLNAGPYAQTRTNRRQACQIDLLLRTRQSVYLVEMKCRKHTGPEVIPEMQEKIKRLKLPKTLSVRTALIHTGTLDPAIDAADYFDFLIPADQWLAKKV